MSVDTTAKPLPNSPARAASTEPLTASMLVWIETVVMASTILSIRRLICSSAAICSRRACRPRPTAGRLRPVHRRCACCWPASRRWTGPSRPPPWSRWSRAGAALDLRDGGGGLLSRGGLLLRALRDLLQRRLDLGGRPVDLLHRRREFLRGRGDFLAALGDVGASSSARRPVRTAPAAACSALGERLVLLVDRLERFLAGGDSAPRPRRRSPRSPSGPPGRRRSDSSDALRDFPAADHDLLHVAADLVELGGDDACPSRLPAWRCWPSC